MSKYSLARFLLIPGQPTSSTDQILLDYHLDDRLSPAMQGLEHEFDST